MTNPIKTRVNNYKVMQSRRWMLSTLTTSTAAADFPSAVSSFFSSLRCSIRLLHNFNTAVDIPNNAKTRLNVPLGVDVHCDSLEVRVVIMVEEDAAAVAVAPPRGMESK